MNNPAFGLVVRIDRESTLPSVLAPIPIASEHEIPALSREGAEDLAVGVSNGALDAQARARWGRLGGGNPLAIVESLTAAVASGEIAWTADRATPRSRAAGRGAIEPAAKWIRRRANAEPTPARAVLSLLAVIGGEANATFMARVFERANIRIDVPSTLAYLEKSRWVVRTQEATPKTGPWFALPTRTHRKALFTTLAEDARRGLHFSIWRVAEDGEGIFGRVEGAWHAAQAGEIKRASAIFLEGAKFAATAHLEASTSQLVAFAQRIDPASEGEGEAVLTKAMERASHRPFPAVSFPPPPPVSTRAVVPVVAANVAKAMAANVADLAESGLPFEEPDSMIERALILNRSEGPGSPIEDDLEAASWNLDDELPLAALASTPPNSGGTIPPTSAPGGMIAYRLGQLAKAALLSPDDAALERWVNGEEAQKESVAFGERMRAMARASEGDIEDALRVLQKTRSELEPNDHRRRCQTSLALSVALSVAGRSHDAMLEAMDALARARQTGDARGAAACLAFLAKLYSSVARDEEASLLRAGSA